MAGREAMTRRERMLAATRREEVDRVPIAFWGHFASDPHRAEDLAAETVAFQRDHDWDFVKLMPSGMYLPEAYGCTVSPAAGPIAANGLLDSVVKVPEDWLRLPVLDPTQGWLGEHLHSIRLVRAALGPDVPIVETLFSPLTVAHKLSVHVPFEQSVGPYRSLLVGGLESIAETTRRFALACLDAGADGFFFATQEANRGALDQATYLELGRRLDVDVLRALDERAWLNLLHVCRTDIYAHLVGDYPVQAVNWDSEVTYPSLTDARQIWPDRCLIGGLDREGPLLTGSPAAVAALVRSAVERAGRQGFVVGAGCGLLVTQPTENLRAARSAVEAL